MLPRTLIGMPMSAAACAMASRESDRVLPSARLYETVVASSPSWWLMLLGVASSVKWATADKGAIERALVFTVAPVDASRRPALAGVAVAVAVDVDVDVDVALEVDVAAAAVLSVFLTGTCTS